MKVAYINCLPSKDGLLGVEKKLAAQAEAVTVLGIDMDIFHCGIRRNLKDNRIRFFRQAKGAVAGRLSVMYRYSCICKYIDTDEYDLVVLRYAGADFSMLSGFFRNNGSKIVSEHHTKELPEAYAYDVTPPQKAFTVLMERFFGPRMIKRCRGLIGVTDEIRQYELERAEATIPACTIPNGVLVKDLPFTGHAAYKGKVLNLLCLANAFEAWKGLDRILAGLQNYDSPRPFLHLAIVGGVSPQDLNLAHSLLHNTRVKVEFLGRLYGHRLEKVFENSHMAFSSLALFRKGMKEACNLKTREFMARGLPFVIGHRDPDLKGDEGFFLSVPPDDSPVNMDEVVVFAEQMLKRKRISESMRQYADERLDWKIKMQQMWDFLKSLS